jgi:hypothetical protein
VFSAHIMSHEVRDSFLKSPIVAAVVHVVHVVHGLSSRVQYL